MIELEVVSVDDGVDDESSEGYQVYQDQGVAPSLPSEIARLPDT
jgi:hypothetical protein